MSSHRSERPPAVRTIAPICLTEEEAVSHLQACYKSGDNDLLKLGATIRGGHVHWKDIKRPDQPTLSEVIQKRNADEGVKQKEEFQRFLAERARQKRSMTPEEDGSTADNVDLGDVVKPGNRNEGIHQDDVTVWSQSARSEASPGSAAQSASRQPDDDGSVYDSVHAH